jgi:hypothetical protein
LNIIVSNYGAVVAICIVIFPFIFLLQKVKILSRKWGIYLAFLGIRFITYSNTDGQHILHRMEKSSFHVMVLWCVTCQYAYNFS